MMTIIEHSFDETMITPGGWVLDAGCGVDFCFSKAMLDMGMKVIAVDPNPRIKPEHIPSNDNLIFINAALVNNKDNNRLCTFQDTDAATVMPSKKDIVPHKMADAIVDTITIKDIMDKYSIRKFDLIKMDIEGAEYDILYNISHTIATQISIEFHDFRNMNPYYPENEKYYMKLDEKLGHLYYIIYDICPKPGWMKYGDSKWDVLLKEKKHD